MNVVAIETLTERKHRRARNCVHCKPLGVVRPVTHAIMGLALVGFGCEFHAHARRRELEAAQRKVQQIQRGRP